MSYYVHHFNFEKKTYHNNYFMNFTCNNSDSWLVEKKSYESGSLKISFCSSDILMYFWFYLDFLQSLSELFQKLTLPRFYSDFKDKMKLQKSFDPIVICAYLVTLDSKMQQKLVKYYTMPSWVNKYEQLLFWLWFTMNAPLFLRQK